MSNFVSRNRATNDSYAAKVTALSKKAVENGQPSLLDGLSTCSLCKQPFHNAKTCRSPVDANGDVLSSKQLKEATKHFVIVRIVGNKRGGTRFPTTHASITLAPPSTYTRKPAVSKQNRTFSTSVKPEPAVSDDSVYL